MHCGMSIVAPSTCSPCYHHLESHKLQEIQDGSTQKFWAAILNSLCCHLGPYESSPGLFGKERSYRWVVTQIYLGTTALYLCLWTTSQRNFQGCWKHHTKHSCLSINLPGLEHEDKLSLCCEHWKFISHVGYLISHFPGSACSIQTTNITNCVWKVFYNSFCIQLPSTFSQCLKCFILTQEFTTAFLGRSLLLGWGYLWLCS